MVTTSSRLVPTTHGLSVQLNVRHTTERDGPAIYRLTVARHRRTITRQHHRHAIYTDPTLETVTVISPTISDCTTQRVGMVNLTVGQSTPRLYEVSD